MTVGACEVVMHRFCYSLQYQLDIILVLGSFVEEVRLLELGTGKEPSYRGNKKGLTRARLTFK